MRKIDAEILQSLRELNTRDEPQFVRDFFILFIKTVPERIDALEKAVKSENSLALFHEAHALKSSCASVGANAMMEICSQLEQMGKKKSVARAPEKFAELKKEYDAVHADILDLPELKAA
jgi:HPt (histidine-containing phosphotransfer) domain-containing protein